jgi:hypothetical protein
MSPLCKDLWVLHLKFELASFLIPNRTLAKFNVRAMINHNLFIF